MKKLISWLCVLLLPSLFLYAAGLAIYSGWPESLYLAGTVLGFLGLVVAFAIGLVLIGGD